MRHCINCSHFHVRQGPLKGYNGECYDLGRAECDKYVLVVDFASRKTLNRLNCVMAEEEEAK